MSKERTETRKKNLRKKKKNFEIMKASFIAGIIIIIAMIQDTISLITPIPHWIEIIEVLFVALLIYLVMGTKKLDKILKTSGIEKFGYFLTIYSFFVFMLERAYLNIVSDEQLVVSFTNDKFIAFLTFVILGMLGIGGAIFLLINKNSKE